MTTEYQTLMIRNNFIDIDKLGKGIYVTERPILLTTELNNERLLDDWVEKIIMDGNHKQYLNNFIDNWNQCELKTIELTIK